MKGNNSIVEIWSDIAEKLNKQEETSTWKSLLFKDLPSYWVHPKDH